MYTFIMVDDEEVIRNGICKFISLGDFGFELAASFEDGGEAIEYLKNNHVDLVLTDVKMIDISGLELAKYIYENCPYTKTIIISGYKEFEYAKEAMGYNVKHYLLKPTQFDELIRIVNEIRSLLDADRENQRAAQEQVEKFQKFIPLLKEQFFVDLLSGALLSTDEVEERIKILKMGINPQTDFCSLIELSMDNYSEFTGDKWKYGKDKFGNVLRNLLGGEEEHIIYHLVFVNANNIKILALSGKYNAVFAFEQKISQHFNEIKDTILKVFGFNIDVKSLYTFNNIFELMENIQNIEKEVLLHSNNTMTHSGLNEVTIEKCKLIVSNITAGNAKEACNLMLSIVNIATCLPIEKIHKTVIGVMELIYGKLEQANIRIPNVEGSSCRYLEVKQIDNVEDIKAWCVSLISKIVRIGSCAGQSGSEFIINKAKEYIVKNFANDISLEEVADHVFLSPVYFSRLFKQQTRENFTDFLVKVRMNYAIQLLAERNLKVYEISERVGYKSSKYFAKLFKKHSGYTPADYSRTVLMNDEEYDENE